MKNVFKFLGIAFVASMLLTACGKDFTVTVNCDATMGSVKGAGDFNDGEQCTLEATANDGYVFVNWSNGETANPYTFTVTENVELTANFAELSAGGATSVTFDGNTWTPATCEAADYASYDLFYARLMEDPNGQNFPIADVTLMGPATGNFSDTYDVQNGWVNGTYNWIEYYAETSLTDGQNYYGDWWAESCTANVTKYDLTAGKVSATFSAVMFDALAVLVNGEDFATAGRKNMTVTMIEAALVNGGKAIRR